MPGCRSLNSELTHFDLKIEKTFISRLRKQIRIVNSVEMEMTLRMQKKLELLGSCFHPLPPILLLA